jgi:hypothetical protein
VQFNWPFDTRQIFYVNITTRRLPWQNIFRLPRQTEPTTAYFGTIESQKLIETSPWSDKSRIFWSLGLRTLNTEQEEFYKQIIQSWYRYKILQRFDVLAHREDNWDGYESKKPTLAILDHAKGLMVEFLDSITAAGHLWLTPFISSDEDGDITVEWHKGTRELHIQIGENEAEYIQVWGTNIDTEMHIDSLNADNYRTLWKWLLDG